MLQSWHHKFPTRLEFVGYDCTLRKVNPTHFAVIMASWPGTRYAVPTFPTTCRGAERTWAHLQLSMGFSCCLRVIFLSTRQDGSDIKEFVKKHKTMVNSWVDHWTLIDDFYQSITVGLLQNGIECRPDTVVNIEDRSIRQHQNSRSRRHGFKATNCGCQPISILIYESIREIGLTRISAFLSLFFRTSRSFV